MQLRKLCCLIGISAALCAPFGCGKNSDGDDATGGSAGTPSSAGSTANGGTSRGGTSQSTSGTGPTGCEGLSPETDAACDDPGIVCPNDLGSCVCQRLSRTWQCFEVAGNEGGAGPLDRGGAGPEMGGVPGVSAEGGEGGALGGAPAAGQSAGGAAETPGTSGAGAGGAG